MSWSGFRNRDNTEIFQTKSDKVSFDIIPNLHSLARVPKKDNFIIPRKCHRPRQKKKAYTSEDILLFPPRSLRCQLKLPPTSYLKTQNGIFPNLASSPTECRPDFLRFGEVAPLCASLINHGSSTFESATVEISFSYVQGMMKVSNVVFLDGACFGGAVRHLAVLWGEGGRSSVCGCFCMMEVEADFQPLRYPVSVIMRLPEYNSPTDYIVHICKQVMLAGRGVGDIVPGGLQAI
jgi:hypothetical protein